MLVSLGLFLILQQQGWSQTRDAEGEHLPPPQRKEGALEKRSKGSPNVISSFWSRVLPREAMSHSLFAGAFHHWSLKWVVLDNHQLLDTKQEAKQGHCAVPLGVGNAASPILCV